MFATPTSHVARVEATKDESELRIKKSSEFSSSKHRPHLSAEKLPSFKVREGNHVNMNHFFRNEQEGEASQEIRDAEEPHNLQGSVSQSASEGDGTEGGEPNDSMTRTASGNFVHYSEDDDDDDDEDDDEENHHGRPGGDGGNGGGGSGGRGVDRASRQILFDNRVRLTGVVWKRRSGLGQYASKAWERRRITLRGSVVSYFKSSAEIVGGSEDCASLLSDQGTQENDAESVHASDASTTHRSSGKRSPTRSRSRHDPGQRSNGSSRSPTRTSVGAAVGSSVASGVRTSIRTVGYVASGSVATVGYVASGVASVGGGGTSPPASSDGSRGWIDLSRERATVAATLGHSGAPTPFAISIKVKNETKWKICFDSRPQLMEWLAVLTDVVVAKSVEEFNENTTNYPSGHPFVFDHASSQYEDYYVEARNRTFVHGEGPSKRARPAGSLVSSNGPGRVPGTSTMPAGRPTPTSLRGRDHRERDHVVRFTEERGTHEPLTNYGTLSLTDASPTTAPPATIELNRSLLAEPKREAGCDGITTVFANNPSRATVLWVLTLVNGGLLYAFVTATLPFLGLMICLVDVGVWVLLKPKTRHEVDTSSFQRAVETVQPGATEVTRSIAQTIPDEQVNDDENDSDLDMEDHHDDVVPKEDSLTSGTVTRKVFKPQSGTTTVRISNPNDPAVNSKNEPFAGWMAAPGSVFKVRSQGYLTSKEKIPAPAVLYELTTVDIFESPLRAQNIATKFRLPQTKYSVDSAEKSWVSPDVFIVSFAMPTVPPKLGRPTTDGVGYNIIMYFTMKEETRNILRRITAPGYDRNEDKTENGLVVQKRMVNGVRLFEEWCRRSPTDSDFQARFKVVPMAHNFREIGVPSWISRYNGKPFLIKRAGVTGFLSQYPDLDAMEFDISLHPFPYLFKQATAYMKEHYFRRVHASVGFVIEGRDDDELPEVMIGEGLTLCYPDPAIGIRAKDLFAGTSCKSFEEGEDES